MDGGAPGSLEAMSEQTKPTHPLVRLAAAAFVAAVLAVVGLATAAPASAHDELLGTDPSPDATVAALPSAITLTFSGILLDVPGAAEVAVTDAGGTSLVAGDPVLDGTRLTQDLTGPASGTVSVLWKVVSSDGHPISGQYAFTVESADSETTDQPAAADDQPAAEDQPTTPPADQPGPMPWWIPLILVGIAASGALLYLAVSRVRRERDH